MNLLAPRHLADVYKAFDPRCEFHEGAKVGVASHDALDLVAQVELLGDRVPWVWLQLLQAHRDATLGGIRLVNLEDLHFNRIANGNDVSRAGHALPCHIGDVQKCIRAIQVDEGAKVREGTHGSVDGLALGQLRKAKF